MNDQKALNLHLAQILDFYDRPLLLLGADEKQTPFLLVLLDEDTEEYIGKEVSVADKEAFLSGTRDLRAVFVESSAPYFIAVFAGQQRLTAERCRREVTEEMLPESGLFYRRGK